MRQINIRKAVPEWSAPTAAWLMCGDSLNEQLAKIWSEIGQTKRLPVQWETMQTIWLNKPGKDHSLMENKRAINLTDPPLKGYLNFLQNEVREFKKYKWNPCTYGGVPGKSAPIAKTVVQKAMSRAKYAKRHFFMYLEDATKAFDKLRRKKLWKATKTQLKGLKHISTRLKNRHRRTAFASKVGKKLLCMKMQEGVTQGDPNGPSLFVMAYEEFGRNIDQQRKNLLHMQFEIPKEWIPALNVHELNTIQMHKHMYVDDHAEIHCINDTKDISALIVPILEEQREWGLSTNMSKSFAMVQMQGRGSRKKLNNLAGKIKLARFGNINITKSSKYLGAIITTDGNANEEITSIIHNAQNAMQRLGNIWRSHELPMEMRIIIFTTMVVSVLTYALEAHVLTYTQTQRLAASFNRMLRRVARSPAHILRKQPRPTQQG